MLSPEINRIILLLAIAISGYLIILQWDSDYSQTASTYESLPITAPLLDGEDLDVPLENLNEEPRLSDVPDNSLIASSPSAQQPSSAGATSDRLIRVRTPMVEMWIDLLGGDIIRAELPGYPFELNETGKPYILLNNGSNLVYVAQSGLIGAHGVASGERRLYR